MYLLDSVSLIFTSFMLFIGVLVGVAFLTLLERKVLGYIQIRKGPNKLGFLGLLQPFSDAIKLFTKEQMHPYLSNFNLYYFSPILNLMLSLMIWLSMPFFSFQFSFNFSVLFFLSFSSLSVYTVMLAGWSSNSNYSLLGAMRAVAQTISYEVSLMIIFLSFLVMVMSFDLFEFMKFQEMIWFMVYMFPLCLMWVVSSLAETNRTPFDFAEGESELVSGFNVEYSSGSFAMIFLAEYSNILFMSMICCLLFLGGNFFSYLFFLKLCLVGFFWVWVRGTLPRYRYDKLMYLAWKAYLPISLSFLGFYFSVSMMMLFFF